MKARVEYWRNDTGRGNRNTRIKTYPNATLSTTHFIWTFLGLNRALRGDRPSPNRLNHGIDTYFSFQEVKYARKRVVHITVQMLRLYCTFHSVKTEEGNNYTVL